MSGGECRKKGKERGLWFEIKCLEDAIEAKAKAGEDVCFEKRILKSYRKHRHEEYNKMLAGQS